MTCKKRCTLSLVAGHVARILSWRWTIWDPTNPVTPGILSDFKALAVVVGPRGRPHSPWWVSKSDEWQEEKPMKGFIQHFFFLRIWVMGDWNPNPPPRLRASWTTYFFSFEVSPVSVKWIHSKRFISASKATFQFRLRKRASGRGCAPSSCGKTYSLADFGQK